MSQRDRWQDQRVACASTLRPVREDPRPACEALIAELFVDHPVPKVWIETPLPGGGVRRDEAIDSSRPQPEGSFALWLTEDRRVHIELQGFPLAFGRAIAGRLAIAWKRPVAWAGMHVAYNGGSKPLCSIASLQQGQFDDKGNPVPPREAVEFPPIDAEALDTDKPWRVTETLLEAIDLRWRRGPWQPDGDHWSIDLPKVESKDPRVVAAFHAWRLARTRSHAEDAGRIRLDLRDFDGARETLFLSVAQAAELGLTPV